MIDDGLKYPIFESLKQTAENMVNMRQNLNSGILPAIVESFDGVSVTVNIEVSSKTAYPKIQAPVLSPEYIRLPIQKGCRGILIPLSVNIEHICGLGQTAPENVPTFNISNMAFIPIYYATQEKVDNDTIHIIGGKNGAVICSSGKSSIIKCENGKITMKADSISIDGDLNIKGKVDIKGGLTINGIDFMSHTHSNGNMGSPTGAVIPA